MVREYRNTLFAAGAVSGVLASLSCVVRMLKCSPMNVLPVVEVMSRPNVGQNAASTASPRIKSRVRRYNVIMTELHVDLVGFADGELSDAEADTIREHLRSCKVCGERLCEELQLATRLSTLSGYNPHGQAVPLSDTENPMPRGQAVLLSDTDTDTENPVAPEHLAFHSPLAPSSQEEEEHET
jgi:hypothetical protein